MQILSPLKQVLTNVASVLNPLRNSLRLKRTLSKPGVERDITERGQTEQRLQEVNDRLQLLIDRMPLGCIVWSPEFRVTLWNPMAEKIFGFASDEMLGQRPFGRILAEELRDRVDRVWRDLLAGDGAAHSEEQNLTRDGLTIVCSWYNTPMFSEEGTLLGVISMVEDVTDRKLVEEELSKYQTYLEELVADRTRMLEDVQDELVRSERLAVLGQLTATVSHEIRNPLGTVANALFLIRAEVEKAGLKTLDKPLALAERNVARCDNIISELLDFSRKRHLNLVNLDVDAWLTELLDELVWPETLELQCNLAAGRSIAADPERLRRAIVNAVENALQALQELADRTPRLAVSTRSHAGRLELIIADNGPGIPEEHFERIFEPMFSTKNFGIGLGVTVIKNILDDHQGGVEYHSRVGEGTTVTMWLPVAGD